MEIKEILQEVETLGLSEKIMLVEDIWGQIAKNNATMPMPQTGAG